MIFVAAGTKDGRELAAQLLQWGCAVTASVVSRYGEQLLQEDVSGKLLINGQALDAKALRSYLLVHHIRAFVDASHPYAVQVSNNAMAVCRELKIPYLRYERAMTQYVYEKLFRVPDYGTAASTAASLGKHIFLTTGSHSLRFFREAEVLQNCVLAARVLPTPAVISACADLGFTPQYLAAMQGPFSTELNCALYRHYQAEVIVTKDSGHIGGTDAKIEAAARLELPVVMIDRPSVAYTRLAASFEEVWEFVREYHLVEDRKL